MLFLLARVLVFCNNIKVPLVSRPVTSSCASNRCVDKAAAKATGNKILSKAAHKYLKQIVEEHEERTGGIQLTVGGWENSKYLLITCV